MMLMWWHTPNGGKRSLAAGRKLKAMGMTKGCPDLCILLPEDHFAMVELKTPKGAVQPEQTAFMDRARAFTPNIFVARSFDEAKACIDRLVAAFPRRTERAA